MGSPVRSVPGPAPGYRDSDRGTSTGPHAHLATGGELEGAEWWGGGRWGLGQQWKVEEGEGEGQGREWLRTVEPHTASARYCIYNLL